MVQKHTVKAFDDELKQLADIIARMGGVTESQLDEAIEALAQRDNARAEAVVLADARIDLLEHEVDEMAVRLIALRQPMAADLRVIIAALKIAPIIERIGDYAKNIAKRSLAISRMAPVRPLFTVPRMGRMAREMIKDVLDAYAAGDIAAARAVWERDHELDEMYDSLFRELLTYMIEDPRNISPCTHLLFVAKNIERIGDLATNISEIIHFQVEGRMIEDDRPKVDEASTTVVSAPAGRGG